VPLGLQALDDLVEVPRDALERHGRLRQPDDEHHRGLGGQLDVHVVGAAQRVGHLVARAPRLADVQRDAQRVPVGHAGTADQLGPDDVDPRRGAQLGPHAPARGERLVQERLAVDGELAARGVQGREQERGGRRGAQEPQRAGDRAGVHEPERPTWSIALWVSDPPILWVDVTHASAPWASALAGTSGWKPKCGPHDWSTTSGTPAAWAAATQPGTSAHMP
jgi:hypothetical protein